MGYNQELFSLLIVNLLLTSAVTMHCF